MVWRLRNSSHPPPRACGDTLSCGRVRSPGKVDQAPSSDRVATRTAGATGGRPSAPLPINLNS